MNTNAFLSVVRHTAQIVTRSHDIARPSRTNAPRVRLASGLELSIQASEAHYCCPRETGADFYTHVEVGFPSAEVAVLMEYAENPSDPTGTVYGFVPVEVVDAIIIAHGGIVSAFIPS